MPQYCFTDDQDHTICRFYPLGKAPRQVRLGKTVFKRNLRAEHAGTRHTPGNWPMKSDAAGVHPSQIKEAYDHSVRIGIPTQFAPDGRAIFTGREHRKNYCRAIGLHDRNGGYGDP
ncbi:hypothetical protein ACQ9LF_10235 [Anaerohalosphaeraceae bacterium U12dextr]